MEKIASWEVINNSNPVKFFSWTKTEKEQIVFEIESGLEALESCFDVAKYQNWTSYFDVIDIQQRYKDFKNKFIQSAEAEIKKEREGESNQNKLTQKENNKNNRGINK